MLTFPSQKYGREGEQRVLPSKSDFAGLPREKCAAPYSRIVQVHIPYISCVLSLSMYMPHDKPGMYVSCILILQNLTCSIFFFNE